jgi:integral membrane protein (TIGR01906 family)
VRTIVRFVSRLQNLALTLIVAIAAGRVVRDGRPALRWIANRLTAGATLTIAVVAGLGVLSLIDFERLFLTFHMMSFDNDLWQLDPRKDNLIRFFPFEFWFDSTVTVATRTVLSALVLAVTAWIVRRWEGRTSS